MCVTAGSDQMLKLWDLRQRRCIRDFFNDDEFDRDTFHVDSIRTITPHSS